MNELESKNIVTEQEESIPPQAQNFMIKIISFVLGRAEFIILFILPFFWNDVFSDGRLVFNDSTLYLSVLIGFFIYFRFFAKKKALKALDYQLKNFRYTIKTDPRGNQEPNLKK